MDNCKCENCSNYRIETSEDGETTRGICHQAEIDERCIYDKSEDANEKRLLNQIEQEELILKAENKRQEIYNEIYKELKEWRYSLFDKIENFIKVNKGNNLDKLKVDLVNEYKKLNIHNHMMFKGNLANEDEVLIVEIIPIINNILLKDIYKKLINK
jgi:hypothetical protein